MTGRGPGAPLVFLERQSYRRRRVRDAARLLPVLGLFAWIVPLLWPRGDEAPGAAGALVYIFAVWLGLVIAGMCLSILLRHDARDEEPDGGGGGAP